MTDTQNEPKAYVLMARDNSDSLEGWWHPIGVYLDKATLDATMEEAKRRLPTINLDYEVVPHAPMLTPTDAGPMWRGEFSYDDDGTWGWEFTITCPYTEDDRFEDEVSEPYSLTAVCGDHRVDAVEYGEKVFVLAQTVEEAREKATAIVTEYVRKQTGHDPVEVDLNA